MSSAGTPKSKPRSARVTRAAATNPAAAPAITMRIPLRMTRPKILARVAPRAMRTPISRWMMRPTNGAPQLPGIPSSSPDLARLKALLERNDDGEASADA
jgi:hypothetical protein